MCDASDAYDLVVLILTHILDNSLCCRLHHLYILLIRYMFHLITTFIEWLIICGTYGFFDYFYKEGGWKYTSFGADPTYGGRQSWMVTRLNITYMVFLGLYSGFLGFYIVLACQCGRRNILAHCFKDVAKTMFIFISVGNVLMLLSDIFMMIYSSMLGVEYGENVIDFSDFPSGFRTVVFFLSILDTIHAITGIVISIVKRAKIMEDIYPLPESRCKMFDRNQPE